MFNCREPDKWPSPPDEMTFTALKAIEACPRQWALSAAEYPGLWVKHGYPPKLAISALVGIVSHAVVERLTREFVVAGCAGIRDSGSIAVMKSLGGYSAVIEAAIHSALDASKQNPRAATVQDYF